MKILVKYPSRGRLAQFFNGLNTLYQHCINPSQMFVLATLDEDDQVMNSEYVRQKAAEYANLKLDYGKSNSKIHAVNRGINEVSEIYPEAADWDVVIVMSDDMQMCYTGWDMQIRLDFESFPDTDGYLHYWEKDSHTALNVMTIKGRKYFERFGFLYHPDYKSLFCDNEQMEVAKMLGRYKFVNLEIFRHLNPAYGYAERDAMFDEQQNIGWTVDQETYNRRKALNFEIEKWWTK